MASELPIVTRIGTPTTTSSNGTSRNAPPAPTSPAPTPTLPHTVAVSGRLKRRGSPMGRDGAAASTGTIMSAPAAVTMRAKISSNQRSYT